MSKRETWRPVIGYEDIYEVSSIGRVRRSFSAPWCASTWGGRILKQEKTEFGYLRLSLSRSNRLQRLLVHRIVAKAFLPGYESGRQVNHKNGNKLDNRMENLEWATARQNVMHAWEAGLCRPTSGERHGMAKLSDDDVRRILFLLSRGVAGSVMAECFGVSQSIISEIKLGKSRRYLSYAKPQ